MTRPWLAWRYLGASDILLLLRWAADKHVAASCVAKAYAVSALANTSFLGIRAAARRLCAEALCVRQLASFKIYYI